MNEYTYTDPDGKMWSADDVIPKLVLKDGTFYNEKVIVVTCPGCPPIVDDNHEIIHSGFEPDQSWAFCGPETRAWSVWFARRENLKSRAIQQINLLDME